MIRAYVDPIETVPGGTVALHARALDRVPVRVQRWNHGDPHPDGPGADSTDCPWGAAVVSAGDEGAWPGSFATARFQVGPARGLTICGWVYPTDLAEDPIVLGWADPRTGLWAQLVVQDGCLGVRGPGEAVRSTGQRIRERDWHFVGASWHPDGSGVAFSAPWGRTGGPFAGTLSPMPGGWDRVADGLPGERIELDLALASDAVDRRGALDGCIAGLVVFEQVLDIIELMDLMNGHGPAPAHAWDFADCRTPDQLPSLQSDDESFTLHQAPAFSGRVPPPVDSAGQPLASAGSLHFHRDDLEDCRWPLAHVIEVPVDAQPGLYCVRLEGSDGVMDVPFVVQRPARVSLLASTLTWQAYGNLGRDPQAWPGRSHYSLHGDGSPVMITTSRRPCPTYGPQSRLEVDGGDGFALGEVLAHLLTADLYAWHWLAAQGDEPGVIGDRALHRDGVAALDGVDVLVLSAHPEYWTAAMLDALERFLARGGNLIYLGGNGLYWVTALHPAKPHLMEVRRWGGSQTCSVDPADRWHQYEQRRGGLWAEQGRPPNALVGVGFCGFGTGPSMTFTRTAASHDPAWAWAFDGVLGEEFGSEGINTGAGNEFDCWDERLATPGTTTILATSQPLTPDHFGVFEHGPARAPDPRLRADLAITQTPAGGLVLAVSSISASGCLVVDPPQGGLRRVCTNILNRMLEGAPG